MDKAKIKIQIEYKNKIVRKEAECDNLLEHVFTAIEILGKDCVKKLLTNNAKTIRG